MKDTYKGYEITYQETTETFNATIGESSYENKSLSAVKKYIDNLDKKDFKRVNVITEQWNRYAYGTVTSVVEVVNYRDDIILECWISFKDGSRKRKPIHHVYLDNKKNRELIELIKEKEHAIEVLNESIRKLQPLFEKYTYEMK